VDSQRKSRVRNTHRQKSFLHFEAMAQLKSPPSNGYFDQKMFGYNNFQMRGLEYNVVDGMSGLMLKAVSTMNWFILK